MEKNQKMQKRNRNRKKHKIKSQKTVKEKKPVARCGAVGRPIPLVAGSPCAYG